MFTIVLILIIFVVLYLIYTNKNQQKEPEKMIDIDDVELPKPNIMAPKINPHFIEAQFHKDYMDVITSFTNLTPDQHQIFNVNNVPCKVTKNIDVSDVGEMVKSFVKNLNKDIRNNVATFHTIHSSWNETMADPIIESGWEKVQKQLGLPSSLYNKPINSTKVHLVQYSDIVKYETENEIKYDCKVVISKENVEDKLFIKLEMVLPKSMMNDVTNIIIENISVIGYLTDQGLGTDRTPMDDYYNFANLEENNMFNGKMITSELMKKYDVRQKNMQEMIDGMEQDVQEKYFETPLQTEYDSYKLTQTIFDDMNGLKKFQ